jgi:hypothetical protein
MRPARAARSETLPSWSERPGRGRVFPCRRTAGAGRGSSRLRREIELGESGHRDRRSLDDLKGECRREHALQLHVPYPGRATQLPLRLIEIEGEDVRLFVDLDELQDLTLGETLVPLDENSIDLEIRRAAADEVIHTPRNTGSEQNADEGELARRARDSLPKPCERGAVPGGSALRARVRNPARAFRRGLSR